MICVTPAEQVCQIKITREGQTTVNETGIQREAFSYLYEPSPVYKNECWKYLNKFSNEVQAGILRGIYISDIFR